MRKFVVALVAIILIMLPTLASAVFDSGSDGSDGAFNPAVGNQTIDLGLAGTGPGTGTYDPGKWAVVFNYTDITIPLGANIFFTNHPSGAPVVWLASGDVTIEGTVSLSGKSTTSGGAAGPGGFAGGDYNPKTRGFGPGGGSYPLSQRGAGGSYGTAGESVSGSAVFPPYGNPQILPLIGGSGGAPFGQIYNYRGGGGGGAILIAASGALTLEGVIYAIGGAAYSIGAYGCGAGSGGGVRLLGTTVAGSGSIAAQGGSAGGASGAWGGMGRVRVEAENFALTATSNPAWTYDLIPGPVFPDATTPAVRIATINGQAVPQDPLAGFDTVDYTVGATTAVEVGIEANNVPVGTTVTVNVVREGAAQSSVTSTPLVGSLALSTATASVTFDSMKNTEIYLKVNW